MLWSIMECALQFDAPNAVPAGANFHLTCATPNPFQRRPPAAFRDREQRGDHRRVAAVREVPQGVNRHGLGKPSDSTPCALTRALFAAGHLDTRYEISSQIVASR